MTAAVTSAAYTIDTSGLIDQVRSAVRRLVDPHDRPIVVDVVSDQDTVIGMELTTAQVPPLLQQLRAARRTGRETGLGRGRSDHSTPIAVAAHDTYTEIDRDVAAMHLRVLELAYAGTPPEHRLRHIGEITAGWTDVEAIGWVLRAINRWTDAIVALLDPPRRFHLAGACPHCGAKTARYRDQSSGEIKLQPALSVNLVDGALCHACNTTWTARPNQLDHLARVINQQAADRATERAAERASARAAAPRSRRGA